jgi:DNA-binding GntR family transcriptional regulator
MDTSVADGPAASAEPPPSAAERAYRFVKAEVLSRRIRPHDVISEGQIGLAVGVSRTPVREALLRLEAEGMLRLLPKKGALVLPVTTEQMLDLIEARQLIEAFAARKVITAGRVADIAALGARLDEHLGLMRAALAATDVATYVSADRDFHAEIVAAAGNAVLSETYRGLRDRQLRMGAVNLLDESAVPDPARMAATLADHEAIAAAIGGRRLRAAESAIEEHLAHSAQLLANR